MLFSTLPRESIAESPYRLPWLLVVEDFETCDGIDSRNSVEVVNVVDN